MKSLKVMAALLVAAAMTSCSAVNPLAATSNTAGTKCGKELLIRYSSAF